MLRAMWKMFPVSCRNMYVASCQRNRWWTTSKGTSPKSWPSGTPATYREMS
jgi:hypothetical protein